MRVFMSAWSFVATSMRIVTIGLVALPVLGAGTPAEATITGISSDGCPGTTCLMPFVTPIVVGGQMSVTVKGQFVDLSTGVEIVPPESGVLASLGPRQGGSNSSIVVKFTVRPSAALGERTVKLHYAIETSGPDIFKVRAVRGGKVDTIQQRVPGLAGGAPRLVAANQIPVNQRVTLVFSGSRLGNAGLAPNLTIKDPQILPGCSETRCEVELTFTQGGSVNVNLFDADVPSAGNNLLFKFFYAGVHQVTVAGAGVGPPPGPGVSRIPSAGTAAPTTFVDVAPGAMLNLFRGTGNSITVSGQTFLQVEDHWCADAGVQTPGAGSIARVIALPDLVWGVANVGTADINLAFDSALTLASNNQALDQERILAGTLRPGGTQNFRFRRATRPGLVSSQVRVIRFALPVQPGCFVNPRDPGFHEDPSFTVRVDVNHVLPEAAVNHLNNARTF
jgi:hypothetical protein